MNNKPDEATLAAYFYGELSGEERESVALYLSQHPEEKNRLEEWSFTKKVMAELPDKEVIAPPIFLGSDHEQRPIWREGYFRMTMGIAASFLLIMVAARLLGFSASYSQGELRLSFGMRETPIIEKASVSSLTENRVNELIQASLDNNNSKMQASWNENRNTLEHAIKNNLTANSSKIDRFIQDAADVNREQVGKFVRQMQADNLGVMKDYMQYSSANQKQYIEGLLVDFSKYLQEQRKQDLQLFQVRMNTVEENTNLLKRETSEILTSLMNPGSTGNATKRN